MLHSRFFKKGYSHSVLELLLKTLTKSKKCRLWSLFFRFLLACMQNKTFTKSNFQRLCNTLLIAVVIYVVFCYCCCHYYYMLLWLDIHFFLLVCMYFMYLLHIVVWLYFIHVCFIFCPPLFAEQFQWNYVMKLSAKFICGQSANRFEHRSAEYSQFKWEFCQEE